MKFNELLKSVLDTEAEGEKELVVALKAGKASDEAIEVAVANFRLQAGFKDKLSKEEFATVAKAAGFAVEKAKPEPDEDVEDPKKPGFLMSGKKMPPKAPAKKSIEGMPEEIRKEFEEQRATIERLEKSASKSAATVVALEKEAKRKEYVTKCTKEFPYVPGLTAEEMGVKLQKAYDVSEEFGKAQEKEWATVSAALGSSTLLTVSGGVTKEAGSSDAMGKVEAIVKELRAADPKLNEAKATTKALQENPELYAEYMGENPAQTGRR